MTVDASPSMDASPTLAKASRELPGLRVAALLVAFAAALGARIAIGGANVSQSLPAGLLFACCLLVVAIPCGTKLKVRVSSVSSGVAAGVLICAPAALAQLLAHRPLRDAADCGHGCWS